MPALVVLLLTVLTAAAGHAADSSGFRKHVQPFLAKHCNVCHSTKAKMGSLDLERYQTAELVLADQDIWEKVARKVRTGEMPPKGRPAPSPKEVQALDRWLATEYARFDKAKKHDPGRVTARRLNRFEYNNTIRDLVGLDLRPADSFPVDDSGYGFDNIGDVLSMSPTLMEKYMVAAERITREAIAVPRTFRAMTDRYRSDRVKHAGPPGSIEVKHIVPIEGDYEVRVALAGKRSTEEDGHQVQVSLDGAEILKTNAFIPAGKPRAFNVTIRPPAGTHVLRAVLTNRDGMPLPLETGILVEYMEVRGPSNPGPYVPPVSHKRILVCGEWPGKYEDACMRQIVETFARRAFRRTVTAEEVDRFYNIALRAKQDGESPERALRFALQAVLVSPQFLFRIEQDPKPLDPKAAHAIMDFELASRLSYFLWSTMPDDTLLDLAAKKQLSKPAVLEQQVRRMLGDEKFNDFVENFVGQWLGLRNLEEAKPAPEKFPKFDEALRQAMKQETLLFFSAVVREDRSILEFLNANYTYLNERLARHYGIDGVTGPEFRRVDLQNPQRGGLVTMASVLTVSSYPNRTSPVIRGKYLLENFLNAPPPPPPPNVPSLEESAAGMKGSLRQQLEKHRSNAVCASCHNRMDSLGFGLENYDAVGAWREKDEGFDIDSSGAFPGGKAFRSPAELKQMLAKDRDDFAQCLTEKMLIYALGRGLEKQDRTFIRTIVRSVAADEYRFSRLVLEIVKSAPFRMRRGEGGPTS